MKMLDKIIVLSVVRLMFGDNNKINKILNDYRVEIIFGLLMLIIVLLTACSEEKPTTPACVNQEYYILYNDDGDYIDVCFKYETWGNMRTFYQCNKYDEIIASNMLIEIESKNMC